MMANPGLGRQSQDVCLLTDYLIGQSSTTSKDKTAPLNFKFDNHAMKINREKAILAKLNEIKKTNVNNPIGELYEINQLMKKTNVEYEVTSILGTATIPVFTVCAKNDDIIAHGCGSTKKNAKKNAAIEFLKILYNSIDQNDIISATKSKLNFCENNAEKRLESNPIGVLQDLCMAKHWPYPYYDFDIKKKFNGSLSVVYIAICFVKMFNATGEGKNKQSAKKQAARLLYDKIKYLTTEENAILNNQYESDCKVLLGNNHFDDNSSHILVNPMRMPSEALKEIEKSINKLKLSRNACINYLKYLSDVKQLKNAVNVLGQIGKEEGFISAYRQINCSNSNVEVMVNMGTIPMLINISCGNTVVEAQEAAARVALSYLKALIE